MVEILNNSRDLMAQSRSYLLTSVVSVVHPAEIVCASDWQMLRVHQSLRSHSFFALRATEMKAVNAPGGMSDAKIARKLT